MSWKDSTLFRLTLILLTSYTFAHIFVGSHRASKQVNTTFSNLKQAGGTQAAQTQRRAVSVLGRNDDDVGSAYPATLPPSDWIHLWILPILDLGYLEFGGRNRMPVNRLPLRISFSPPRCLFANHLTELSHLALSHLPYLSSD